MARKPTPAPQSREVAVNEELIAADVAAANALALAQREAAGRAQALATQLNYQGSLAPESLENGAREAIRRINMGVFELGAYLLLLREACGHGEFAFSLERLNLEPRAAQRYMQVTRRFSANASLKTHLEGIGKTKLLEMLVLDDDQLDELACTGMTGELALDDVATMSVKELRAAVREAREERQADQALLTKKNARIDKLERDVRRIKQQPQDEAWASLQREAVSVMNDARGAVIGGLRQALVALNNHPDPEGNPAHGVFMAGLVGQVQADLAKLRDEFQLPDVSSAEQLQQLAEMSEWNKA